MRATLVAAFSPLLLLCGCGDGEPGTTITINAPDREGNVSGSVDGKTGEVAVKVPGFAGRFTLPKIKLDADDFDLNGVHLYPGSTIGSVNIVGGKGDDGDDGGRVRVAFESPADPATVRHWFDTKLGGAGFKLATSGNALVGTDNEGKPVRIELSPAANGHARGIITAGA